MKTFTYSGNNAEGYVLLPELSRILCDGESMSQVTSNAFVTAGSRGRKLLLSVRQLLNSAYPDGTFKCRCAEEFVFALEKICNFASENPIDGTYPLLPSTITPPANIDPHLISDAVYERIPSVGGEITVDLTDVRNIEFATRLLRFADRASASLSIVTDRRIPSQIADSIARLWKSGTSVTLCNRTNSFELLGFCGAPVIFKGAAFSSGDAVIRQLSLDPSLFNGCTSPFFYSTVKAVTDEILSDEFSRRYCNDKGKHVRFRLRNYSPLSRPWFCCYKCAFQNIKSTCTGAALTGAPKHDILLLDLGDIRNLDPCNTPRTVLKYFSAASTVFRDDYPFRLIPYYRDIVCIDSTRDLTEALITHAESVCGLSVSSVLELIPSRSFEFPEPSELSSLISGFYGLGGASIQFSRGGERS